MMWSDISKPTEGVSFYDYTYLDTPIGRVMVEWKSWKESPDYSVSLKTEDVYIGTAFDLESAKDMAFKHIADKLARFMTCQKRKPLPDGSLELTSGELEEFNKLMELTEIKKVFVENGFIYYTFFDLNLILSDVKAILYLATLFDLNMEAKSE